MSNNTGGPAFPLPVGDQECCGRFESGYGGMTLRDYFAAKAMQGLCSSAFKYMAGEGHATPAALAMMKDIGVVAYQMADAMLKAREVDNGNQ